MAPPTVNPSLRTTTKLLDALRAASNDEPAWSHIDARYRGVIAGLAKRMGLQEDDAADVAQQTLAEFVRVYRAGKYDREKGRLSSWILGIAHRTALAARRASKREVLPGSTAMEAAPDEHAMNADDALRSVWDEERDRLILQRALDALRDDSGVDDRTLHAFELVALRGVPVGEAAMQCGMSVDQVYVVKSRTTKRLRKIVEELTSAFEEDR